MNDDVIPLIRNDINLYHFEEKDNQYLLMSDNYGYAKEEIIISIEFYNLLNEIGGKTKNSELSSILQIDDAFIIEQIINNIKNLDELGYLNSPSFRQRKHELDKHYLDLKVRPYICGGSSYPENPEKLNIFLDKLFASADVDKYASNSNAIIVPHIDLRLNEVCHPVYAAGYHTAKNTDFDLLVILGTAHYEIGNIFMLSNKNYSTPLGISETDFELINLWQKNSIIKLDFNEFAHKPEHSIEYHILLSQYYFTNKKFKVLPILVSSFEEFIVNGRMPDNSVEFKILIESLNKSIIELGRKPLFVASVDFSHVGRKFGDDYDAFPTLQNLELEDKKLIDSISKLDKKSFFNKIIADCNKYKICGTAPIYSLLSIADFKQVDFLKYSQWDEDETKSAVTFASLALYN